MNSTFDRRLRRLEAGTAVSLPWGRPAKEWSDEQLMAVIGEPGPISDERLAELAKEVLVIGGSGDAIMLGVPEAASTQEWIEEYAPPARPAAVVHISGAPPRKLDS